MKRSVIAIILTASLLVSVCSCSRDPEPSVTETLPRVTTATAPSASDVSETSAPTETIFPSRDMRTMSINEVEEVLLNAAGRGEPDQDQDQVSVWDLYTDRAPGPVSAAVSVSASQA